MKTIPAMLLVSLLAACASSEMRIEAAIYDGDPVMEFTATGVEGVLGHLEPLRQSMLDVVSARKKLAESAVSVYEAYLGAFNGTLKNLDIGAKKERPQFEAAVDEALQEFEIELESVRDSGARFLAANDREAKKVAEGAFRGDVGRVQLIYRRILSSRLGGKAKNFEDGFLELLPEVMDSAKAITEGAGKDALMAKLEAVLQGLKSLRKSNYSAIRVFETSIKILRGAEGAGLKSAANSALVTLAGGLASGDEGLEVLQRRVLAAQIGASIVDSVQDAADPVWRQVAAPANAAHWNTRFEESYAYAEGNSSVVIVQDSPLSYRVQRSSNDPRALVAGQLAISRAVANAAVEVASAAAGIPSKPLGAPQSSTGNSGATTAKSPSVAVTRSRLDAEARARVRAQFAVEAAIDGFATQLAAIGAIPDSASADEKAAYLAKVEALRDDLKAGLSGTLSGFAATKVSETAQAQGTQR